MLGEQAARLVDQRGSPSHELLTDAMQRLDVELLRALDRDKPHVRAQRRLADRLGITCVVLGAFHVGTNELGVDQPHLEAEIAEPATPVVGATAGLHRDHPRRQLDHRLRELGPAHALRHHRSPARVDAVQLEHALGEIDAKNRYHHGRYSLSSHPPDGQIGREASIP